MKRNAIITSLVILVIVFIVAACAAVYFLRSAASGVDNSLRASEVTRAKVAIKSLHDACIRYAVDKDGKYPPNLDALVPDYTEQIDKDPWGRSYEYRVAEDDCIVQSAGPDGNSGTADDVTSTSLEN